MKPRRKLLFFLLMALVFSLSNNNEAKAQASLFTPQFLREEGFAGQDFQPVQGMAVLDDTVYVYTGASQVYSWRDGEGLKHYCDLPRVDADLFYADPNDEQAQQQINIAVTHIMADEQQLYGLNAFTGRFGRIDTQGIHWQDLVLDASVLRIGGEYPNPILQSLVLGDKLYLLVEEFSYNDGVTLALYALDKNTGISSQVEIDNLQTLARLDTDRLLLLTKDELGLQLVEYNTFSGAIKPFPISFSGIPAQMDVGGLAIGDGGSTIVLTAGSIVYQSKNAQGFVPAAILEEDLPQAQAPGYLTSDGRYLLLSGSHAQMTPLGDVSHLPRLMVQSGTLPGALRALLTLQHPQVVFTHVPAPVNPEQLAQALLTKDQTIDVFSLRVDHTFTSLIQKEYLFDLSQSPLIKQEMALLDPVLQQALTDDSGRVYGYPQLLKVWRHGFYEGFWNLGFEGQPLPTSYEEMLDAWLIWERDFARDYPEIEFVEAFDYATWCETLLSAFAMRQEMTGSLPDFTDSRLREQLEKLSQIARQRRENGTSVNLTQEEDDAWFGKTSIFTSRMYDALQKPPEGASGEGPQSYYGVDIHADTWVPFSFLKDDAKRTDAHLYVYAINPYSDNLKEALALIELATTQQADPALYQAIRTAMADKVEDPAIKPLLEQALAEKTLLEQQIKDNGDQNTTALDERLAQVIHNLKELEAQRWLISVAELARSQSLPGLDVHANSLLVGDSGNSIQVMVKGFCQRYAQGQMSLDELLNELNRTMAMVEREN